MYKKAIAYWGIITILFLVSVCKVFTLSSYTEVSSTTDTVTVTPLRNINYAFGNASVLKVVDGDTMRVFYQGATTTVRLIGLDTPETVDPRRPVECFGLEASAKAVELLPSGITVRLETDATQDKYDKYGRLLVYLYIKDDLLFNKAMIEQGYGYEYTHKVPYQQQALFKAAQAQAQEYGRGLWAQGVCRH